MYKPEFDAGLERIKRTFPKLEDGTIDEVERRWMGLDVQLWKRMCQWIIEHATFAPKPAKFLEAHTSCRMSWKEEDVVKPKCPHCFNSCGFKWVYYRANGNYPYSGITPCLYCNRDQFIPKSESKIGERISEAEWDRMVRNPKPDPAFEPREAVAVLEHHGRGPSQFKHAAREIEAIKAKAEVKRKEAKAVGPTEEPPY